MLISNTTFPSNSTSDGTSNSIWLCYPHETYRYFWINDSSVSHHNLSRCFYDLNFSLFLFLFLFLTGLTQYVFFSSRKPLKAPILKNYLALFNLTLYLLISSFIILLKFIHLIISSVYQTQTSRIFILAPVISDIIDIFSWFISIDIIYLEKHVFEVQTTNGIIISFFWFLNFAKLLFSFGGWANPHFWWRIITPLDKAEFIFFVTQSLLVLATMIYYVTRIYLKYLNKNNSRNYSPVSEEMVSAEEIHAHTSILQVGSASAEQTRSKSAKFDTSTGSPFKGLMSKLIFIFPYIWPKKNFLLQFKVIIVILCLIGLRVLNVLIPIYGKNIINDLTAAVSTSNTTQNGIGNHISPLPWQNIVIYCALSFLGGFGATSGLLKNINNFFWIDINQFTYKKLQLKLFAHLHHLPLRFHLSRKTGAVLRIMDRGTNSVTNLLQWILFQICPALLDILIAVIYFVIAFDLWFGMLILTTMLFYLLMTIWVTEARTKLRRQLNELSNNMQTIGVDSLLNFETVKYNSGDEFEVNQLSQAITEYQRVNWTLNGTLCALNLMQTSIQLVGFLAGAMLCSFHIVTYELTVGDYVLFSMYLIQLYGPLNFFGTYYRIIQQAFIDMDNMFELFETDTEIMDKENAPDLAIGFNEVRFNNVDFYYYPGTPILHDVTFIIPSGQTLALVGPSGSGKTTIARLLFRFYDVTGGSVIIDGQDVRDITQKSLRKNIGVVPQDTVLFNKSIIENLRYGKISASDEEVEQAAIAAELHFRILEMPNSYKTLVGERGLRLSGGEKQRVAIGRTILKSPGIVLFDEATSALDTKTERSIQNSLKRICANRTTLIVAHRLSTIIHADEILVLNEGRIEERGTHQQLLDINGLYASMWSEQQKAMEKEEENDLTKE